MILLSAVIGTSLMSIVSYTDSKLRRKDFFEPQILNRLLYRIDALQSPNINHFAGWIIHFTAGLVISVALWAFIENFVNNLGLTLFMILGALIGAASCFIWEAVFQIHPYPLKMNLTHFYIHSVIIHIAFGVGCWIAFQVHGTVAASIPF